MVEGKKHVKVYLDGELKKTTLAPNPIGIAYGANDKPAIAWTRHMSGIWYVGAIDEVSVFERALSEAKVKRLHMAAFDVESAGKLAVVWGRVKKPFRYQNDR